MVCEGTGDVSASHKHVGRPGARSGLGRTDGGDGGDGGAGRVSSAGTGTMH